MDFWISLIVFSHVKFVILFNEYDNVNTALRKYHSILDTLLYFFCVCWASSGSAGNLPYKNGPNVFAKGTNQPLPNGEFIIKAIRINIKNFKRVFSLWTT